MAAGSTYTPIATYTAPSAQSSVTFSSISGSYTDLILIISGSVTGSGVGSIYAQFNGDTSTNYSTTLIYGLGSGSGASTRESSVTAVRVGYITDSVITNSIAQFMNYSNSTTYKTVMNRGNISDSRLAAMVGLWRSTSAITSMVITNNSGSNFATGCTFTLYGIAAA